MSNLPSDDELRSTLSRRLGFTFDDWSMPDAMRMDLDVEQAVREAMRQAWPQFMVTAVIANLRHEGEVDTISLQLADASSGTNKQYWLFP
ncbi:hypothetical protein [Labrys neptuniae]